MRNQSESTSPETENATETSLPSWQDLRREFSKEDLAKAVHRLRRQVHRMRRQRDDALHKLRQGVIARIEGEMSKDMGHECGVAPTVAGERVVRMKCRRCSARYWLHDTGVCAAKVNDKLDAYADLDKFLT
jgi:hypothetical protein